MFYTKTLEERQSWIDVIKNLLNIRNFMTNYKIEEDIHIGKYVTVKKGINKFSNEMVAIKIFSKSSTLSESANFENLITEVDILKILNHHNVVSYVDFFEDLTNFYLVTEYLEGGDLSKFLKLPKEDYYSKALIIYQMCEGIRYLHSIGIVHRDIKPMNIALSCNLTVKIIDFGFSAILGNSELCTKPYGTAMFAAPEIFLQQLYNKNIDIWSLGMTIFYIFYKKLPFKNEEQLKEAYTTSFKKNIILPPLEETKSQLIQDLLTKCLQKDCSIRFTIEDVWNHSYIRWLGKVFNL